MNYNHLLYFKTLAKYEHYGKAAEELHITQPSLSNAIHILEKELNVSLFEKSGRGVRMTKQGTRYLEYVNKALNELRLGEEMLHYEQIQGDYYLRIGVVLSIANHPFPEWIAGFQREIRKKVYFSCANGTSDVLCQELNAGNLDLILCSGLDDPRIEFVPLFEQKLVLLVPGSHRLASRKAVDIHELNGEDFVAHGRNTALHEILAGIYRQNGIHVRIVSEADEDRAVLGMVRAGMGCGVTTQSPELFGPDFAAVPIEGVGSFGRICIGRRRGLPLSAIAEAFWTFLAEQGTDSRST